MASLEFGIWKNTTSPEHIPFIVAYTLIHWVFYFKRQSSGYGFPFDRPYLFFYRRLQITHRLLGEVMDVHLRGLAKDNKPFLQIYRAFEKAVEGKRLNDLAANLDGGPKYLISSVLPCV